MKSDRKRSRFRTICHGIMRGGLVVLASMLTLSCSVFGIRSEEQPVYEVLHRDGHKEIRRYQGYLIATTWSAGDYEQASNRGFRRLADYISGANSVQQNIAMTAPVLQENARTGDTIAMTAPVLQEPERQGWTMSFIIPSTYTMETVPRPFDDSIALQAVPAAHVAVLRYSWGTGGERITRLGQKLLAWIEAQERYEITSPPRSARYDPPFTLPFLRRNEIHVDVRDNAK